MTAGQGAAPSWAVRRLGGKSHCSPHFLFSMAIYLQIWSLQGAAAKQNLLQLQTTAWQASGNLHPEMTLVA